MKMNSKSNRQAKGLVNNNVSSSSSSSDLPRSDAPTPLGATEADLQSKIKNQNSKIPSCPNRFTSERRMRIHQMISGQRFPNTCTIARELQVSKKTIKRDIAWM